VVPKISEVIPTEESADEVQSEEIDFVMNCDDPTELRRAPIITNLDGENIYVVGSWDNWQKEIKLRSKFNVYKGQSENYAYLKLLPNKYE